MTSPKYTFASSSAAFERIWPGTLKHLSDGSAVFIYSPTSGTYRIGHTVDRATVTDLATLPIAANGFAAPGTKHGWALCVDASDNLYVVGVGGSSFHTFAAQAFAKSGSTWTGKGVCSLNGNGSGAGIAACAVEWVNSGGGTNGAGHLVALIGESQGTNNLFSVDAGYLLAQGFSTTLTSTQRSYSSPFGSNVAGAAVDLQLDGFGSGTGVVILLATSGYLVGSFTLSSSTLAGSLAFTALPAATGTAASSSNDFVRVVRPSSNLWLVLTPSDTTSGRYKVARYSSTARLTASTEVATTTTLPMLSAASTPTYDMFADLTDTTRVWLIVTDPSTGTTSRVSLSTTSLAAGTVLTEGTFSPWVVAPVGYNNFTAVAQPRGTAVDYLIDAKTAATPTYAAYGDYATLNVAPNAPTLSAPADNATIDLTATNRFRWAFSDPDLGDSQSAFDLQYRKGTGAWSTVSGTTPNQYVDIASGTFVAGSYEWQVRTYDHLGVVGPWSSSRFFTAATPPSGLSITAPTSGQVIGAASFLVQWSASSQDAYQVRVVADNAGVADATTVYYDSDLVTSSGARSLTVPFPTNGITCHVQVQITVAGLASSWADVTVSVSYTPPATPTLAVNVVQVAGADVALQLVPTQPTPTGTQPNVTSIDIYRRVAGDGSDGQRYATALGPSQAWTDWRVASGVDYEYRIRSFGTNGTQADSEWTRSSLLFPADDLFPSTSTYPK